MATLTNGHCTHSFFVRGMIMTDADFTPGNAEKAIQCIVLHKRKKREESGVGMAHSLTAINRGTVH